jgi:WD40 repeat protein
VFHLAFADERTLLTAGDGGLRRWDLETGSQQLIARSAPGRVLLAAFSADAHVALTVEQRPGGWDECKGYVLHDLGKGTSRPMATVGPCRVVRRVGDVDPEGSVFATASVDGIVRVGLLDGSEPHLLLGHEGVVDGVAISPDLRWVATSGEDNTLRLWPMPDLQRW